MILIAKNRYPDIPCGKCGKLITDRKSKAQRYCCPKHREAARKPRKR